MHEDPFAACVLVATRNSISHVVGDCGRPSAPPKSIYPLSPSDQRPFSFFLIIKQTSLVLSTTHKSTTHYQVLTPPCFAWSRSTETPPNCTSPSSTTSPSYHITIPHHHTTSPYHITLLYHITPPLQHHPHTTPPSSTTYTLLYYHTPLLHPSSTNLQPPLPTPSSAYTLLCHITLLYHITLTCHSHQSSLCC
jgi:hypothetical protein